MADKLSADDRSAHLASMSGWAEGDDGKSIRKTFKFDGFEAAWGFMTRVAIKAQTLDHHPDWSNAYSTVEVSLSTHDAGGVTDLDIELAKYMDTAASNTGGK
ncbi:4a-hydroxytetrahydrobiopterin dehydratase [Thalassobaculum sp. OXR-137]|uniref:4a-hydroxytetrahydrobiopterin dehydratase n=1 Tax=Thalassobaculum sp. OXR-137 TaxID=3100173 RepID=UPI002AC96154|nr:4a-hydroxytetrahydrobiopterin dehydratase [Thalassobaculum sp. OXR-137]WPZ36770.1 4a-hydroxytetrahydrobiopterin dehydratase [Thalassobaculum sp. OXR-137]